MEFDLPYQERERERSLTCRIKIGSWFASFTHSKAIGHSACLATVHQGKHKLEVACQHSNSRPPSQWQVSIGASLLKDVFVALE